MPQKATKILNYCLEAEKQQSNAVSNVFFPVDRGNTVREKGTVFWKAASEACNPLPFLPRQAPTCVILPLRLSTQKPQEGGKSLPWDCTDLPLPSSCTRLLTPDSPAPACGQRFSFSKPMPLSALLCPSQPCCALCHQTSACWLSQKLLSWAVTGREAGRHLSDRCSSGPVGWELVTPKAGELLLELAGILWGSPS